MKSLVTLILLFLTTGLHADFSPEQRTVKVHVTQQSFNPSKPWTRVSAKEVSGSGLIYKSGHVLTNAHVVRNARQVYIQPFQSSRKIEAEVLFYAHGMDLAIIAPTDGSLLEFDSVEIDSTIPSATETIKIYGYPKGGNELSITEGVISRIEFASYRQGVQGLRLQVDAAINSGNSGGPVYAGDRFIGIGYSHQVNAENMTNVIPAEEVALFLADVEDDEYDGKPFLHYRFRNLQNRNMRELLMRDSGVGGQLVVANYDIRVGDEGLQPMDVLVKIGEHEIDRTGKVKVRDDLRLSFKYFVPRLVRDGHLPVTYIREGALVSAEIPLRLGTNALIPYTNERQPDYFIYGPLVFAGAVQEFASGFSKKSREQLASVGYEPLYRRYEYKERDGEELVICPTKMFPHPMTKGYKDPAYSVLKTVNGVEILNLVQLVRLLGELDGEDYVTFVFADVRHTHPNVLVFKHQEVIEAMDDLLSDNGIRSAYSKPLKPYWDAY